MKRALLLIGMMANLLGQDAMATVAAVDDGHWAVATTEVTFAAASLYLGHLGLSNGHEGFAGNHSLTASVLGLAAGITSIALSAHDDAEVPAVDVTAGIIAVMGSVLRLPRVDKGASH